MKEIHILNANGKKNNNVENLFYEIFKNLNIKPIFHNSFVINTCEKTGVKIPMHLDLIYFDGGEDVCPSLYYEAKHPNTYTNRERDNKEKDNFNLVRKYYPNIPSFGICRGAQMLTVLSGGSLIQHVENHTTDHEIEIPTFDKIVTVTSSHHQMMYPFNLKSEDYRIIGYSKNIRSNIHQKANSFGVVINIEYPENFVEPEIIFYKKTNSLCIQGHPEYSYANNNFKNLTKELLLRQLYNQL